MKKKLITLLSLLIVIAGCSPTFPLIQDTRPATPTPTNTPWIVGPPGDTATPVATVEPTATPTCDIKGNINEKGERRYFTKASINYKNVKITLPGEKLFCTTAEAEAAGFKPALK